MKSSRNVVIALVTAPDLKTARALAAAALDAKAAACANLVPKVESHYWWEGRIERGLEVLMIFKTLRGTASKLERIIVENHPYDTPECLFVPVDSGAERYLAWVSASVAPASRSVKKASRRGSSTGQ